MMQHTLFELLKQYYNQFEFGVYNDSTVKPAVWPIAAELKYLSYLRFENARGRHIFLRPETEVEEHFMLIDDLNHGQVEKHKGKQGRLIVETSPANYQVWVHSQKPLSLEEKRYWLRKLDSDPGADPCKRWGRCPGFTNRKVEYLTHNGYPFAKVVEVDFNTVQVPKPIKQNNSPIPLLTGTRLNNAESRWTGQIFRSDYDSGDESITDIRYVMALIKRGYSVEEITNRLLRERQDWRNHQGDKRLENYLKRTICKAQKYLYGQ
jgi:hypothetical protein